MLPAPQWLPIPTLLDLLLDVLTDIAVKLRKRQ